MEPVTEREQLQTLVRDLGKIVERAMFAQATAPAVAAEIIRRLDQIVPNTSTRLATALCRPEQITVPADPFEL